MAYRGGQGLVEGALDAEEKHRIHMVLGSVVVMLADPMLRFVMGQSIRWVEVQWLAQEGSLEDVSLRIWNRTNHHL